MQYLGSKRKIAKDILKIVLEGRTDEPYVEPFCGGCNSLALVTGERWANDSHRELIAMWKALQEGWIPPSNISKEEYYEIKMNQYPPELAGFVGFMCSFGAKWWGGYAANKKGDNYALRGKNVLLKQIEQLKDVHFTDLSYLDLYLNRSFVYCDPPYAGTTKYRDDFDHEVFWDWVRETSKRNIVFVSEYSAPPDFECVLEIPTNTILDKNSQYPRTEKLFKHESNDFKSITSKN